MHKLRQPKLMWEPKEDSGVAMKNFQNHISEKYGVKFDDYWSFQRWTAENFRTFWAEIWDLSNIICSKPYDEVFPKDAGIMDSKKWFPGARLNMAENLMKYRDDHVAFLCDGEDRLAKKVTYSEVYLNACRYAASLRKLGLKKGDYVACYMSNREEAVFAMLAAISIGAIWGGPLPTFGPNASILRLNAMKPKFLFTIDKFTYEGKVVQMLDKLKIIAETVESLEKIIIVPSKAQSLLLDISSVKKSCFLHQFLAFGSRTDGSVTGMKFEQLPFDHPVYVNFTSGTTGQPKALIHHIGILLPVFCENFINLSGTRQTICLSISPVGWATWNMFASTMLLGLTVVMYEGVPFPRKPTFIWDLVDKYKISNLFTTPYVLDEMENKGILPGPNNDLSSLKIMLCGGNVVKLKNFDFAYEKVKKDIMFSSIYGATEILGSCMVSVHNIPVYRGEMQSPILGLQVQCLNDEGKPVEGEVGELAIATPYPALPIEILDDENGDALRATYGKFEGAFALGDICMVNPVTNGVIIYGRSDNTLKGKGQRYGSGEIYNIVDAMPEIACSLCVAHTTDKYRVVLFVKMMPGFKFTDSFVDAIGEAIAEELSENHIPDIILSVPDIPRNMNDKRMESLVKKIINNEPHTTGNVKNPKCLQYYYNMAVRKVDVLET